MVLTWRLARRPRLSLNARHLPWLVLTLGLLTTTLVCENQRRFNHREHVRIEHDLADAVIDSIRNKLRGDQSVLDAVVGLFNASEAVTLQEFSAFYRSLDLRPETLEGIQGVGYAAVVPPGERQRFEHRVQQDGQPNFRIRSSGKQPLLSTILYLEPNNWRNQRAKGFDMYSEASRRAAMNQAAITGLPALSGPVRLLQETNVRPQVGTLLYVPIYAKPTASLQSPEDRLTSLRGWAYSPLRLGDLIDHTLNTIRNPDKVDFAVLIYDGEQRLRQRLLYDNHNLAGSPELTHPTWQSVPVVDRSWLIGIQLDHRNLSPTGWTRDLTLLVLLGTSLSSIAALLTRNLVQNHILLRQSLEQERINAQERALAATVFETSPVATVVTDSHGVILRANPAFTQLSGYSALEARGNKTNLMRSGRHDDAFYQQLWQSLLQRRHWTGELWNLHRNGQLRLHELQITAVLDPHDQITNFLCTYRDITERHSQEEQIRHQATHDPLTNLPNRMLLLDRLNHTLALARREGHGVGLIFIDLNGFKPINDTYGHLAGDQLLQAVARRMQSCLRESDSLCRLGGDEFVLLIPDAERLEHLQRLAERLEASLHAPFREIAQVEVRISASFGIARWPDHAADADQLLQVADQAMYRAKKLPRHNIWTAGDADAASHGDPATARSGPTHPWSDSSPQQPALPEL